MQGGHGNDTYYADNIGDFADEVVGINLFDAHGNAVSGYDIIYASVNFTLSTAVEELRLVEGSAANNGTGTDDDDVIKGNSNDNFLQGLADNDRLYGYDGVDQLDGGAGEDELFGGNDNDILVGGSEVDTLDGGTGADEMWGGLDDDIYHIDNAGDEIVEFALQGEDSVYSTRSLTLFANVENLNLAGSGELDGTGNSLRNTIIGNGSDNELRGLDGEDILKGGGGADTLRGGNQNDELRGGAGDDILRGDGGDDEMFGGDDDDDYFVNSAGDGVIESAGEGYDTVFVSGVADYTLTTNVEALVLVGGQNGTGNAGNNSITGNSLDNIIDGGDGQDTMEGRQGDDTYIVNQSNDIVAEASGQGNDTVRTSVTYTLGAGNSVETLRTTNDTGTAAINLTGNEINNTIVGNDGNNDVNGRGGSDVIDGRGGIDTVNYLGHSVGVTVVLGQNGAPGFAYEFALVTNQVVMTGFDTLFNVENVEGSTQGDTLVGNELVNQLRGFNGNDVYVVQNAGDTIVELANQGADEVRTSVSYTLAATNADIETLRTTDETGTAAINLTGNGVANQIFGNAGNNVIDGGGNNDRITGGRGLDTLIGNAGGDTFVWRDVAETGVTAATADLIQDFSFTAGDRIDLSQIDANVFAPNDQPFQFIGQAAFSLNGATADPSDLVPGEIRFFHSGNETVIELQTGTSADIEAVIRIAGIVTPEGNWFV